MTLAPDAGRAAEDSLAAVRRIEAELMRLLKDVKRRALANAHLIDPQLQASGYVVLVHVVQHEPVRASEVAHALQMDKGAVSRQVQLLEELDLVARVEDAEDRRAQRLVLSARGRERLDLLAGQRRQELEDRLRSWPLGELEAFATRLAQYNAALED